MTGWLDGGSLLSSVSSKALTRLAARALGPTGDNERFWAMLSIHCLAWLRPIHGRYR